MQRLKNGVVAVLALTLLLCSTVRAQVMQLVPPSSLMVVKVNNLKSVNEKIAAWMRNTAVLATLPPEAAQVSLDPLAFLQVQLQMQQGVDTAGELAFVMLDPASVPGATGPQDTMVILAPVSDYKTFLGNWPDAKSDGAVTEVKIAGDTSYVASWGKYAAISPGKAIVAAKPATAVTLPAVTSRELSARDIVLYANVATLRGKAMPELQQARAQAIQTVEGMLAGEPKAVKFTAVAKAAVSQLLNIAEAYLRDADAATVGLNISAEGLNVSVSTEFTPTSYLGKTVSAFKGTESSLLTGLPPGKYLFYGGSIAGDPAVNGQLMNDLVDPIITELLAIGPEWTVARDYAEAMKSLLKATRSSSFAMVAPSGPVGAESLMQVITIQGGDTAAMKDANAKMLASQDKLMSLVNIPGAPVTLPKHTPNAKVIDGVSFDSMVTKLEMNPQDPVAAQQAQIMSIIYGPEGAVAYTGVVNDKMLTFLGAKEDAMAATIAAVKQNSSALEVETNVKAVSMQLPKSRLGVVYINAGEIASTGLNYARQFGLALPVVIPGDLPPVGVAVGTEGTALRIDAHISSDMVRSFVAAADQAQKAMQGGAPPGGGL